ncbi:MAG: ATP-binding protein [Thiothrix sp.]
MAFGKLTMDWRSTIAAVWRSNRHFLKPIRNVDLVNPDTLLGIDEQKAAVFRNTENFLRGKPASHVLLWGARGGGKSSLIKAVLTRYHTYGLRMIQISKDDLSVLVDITDEIVDTQHRFIIYIDDLTFEEGSGEYRQLKITMEGTLEKPPENVLIYATSNRRHLMPERMADNHATVYENGEIHPSEAAEDKLSLADRFGLSLPFRPMSQEVYLDIVDKLFKGRVQDKELMHQEALAFAIARGGTSGRTARHFFNHCQTGLN